MQRILFFGDSLTAGYGLSDPLSQSFPALIGEKIKAANLSYKVTNGGLSGDTSFGGLQRINQYLKQPIDIFVLALGANDLIRGVPTSQTLQNLQAIIDLVKRHNPFVKLVMLGMEIPTAVHPKINSFSKIFRHLADKNQMHFLPFLLVNVAGIKNLNLADGFHPSYQGYQVIANNVWQLLRPLCQRHFE